MTRAKELLTRVRKWFRRPAARPKRPSFRPRVEEFEGRIVPADYIWNGAANAPWNVGANWISVEGGFPDDPNDQAAFDPAQGSNTNVTLPVAVTIGRLRVGGDYTAEIKLEQTLTIEKQGEGLWHCQEIT